MPRTSKPHVSKPSQIYQFKITLLDVEPPIWRRIQVLDCSLDKLHEHIQTAMGWTNSHLHQFEMSGQCYGDPELLCDGWDHDFVDSTKLRLSKLLEGKRESFRFQYEYDFGDRWRHELVYEGARPVETGAEYPRCTEGARACPPEDVGGPWGYVDFLATIRDAKHEDHDARLEWVGGRFDPEVFDPREATKNMQRGLPNWRDCLDRIIARLQSRLRPSEGNRAGRPTDPSWDRSPKVPMTRTTAAKLARLARRAGWPVSPMQVAAQLLEDAVARLE